MTTSKDRVLVLGGKIRLNSVFFFCVRYSCERLTVSRRLWFHRPSYRRVPGRQQFSVCHKSGRQGTTSNSMAQRST